jgi:hypothetical protein
MPRYSLVIKFTGQQETAEAIQKKIDKVVNRSTGRKAKSYLAEDWLIQSPRKQARNPLSNNAIVDVRG